MTFSSMPNEGWGCDDDVMTVTEDSVCVQSFYAGGGKTHRTERPTPSPSKQPGPTKAPATATRPKGGARKAIICRAPLGDVVSISLWPRTSSLGVTAG